jgi:hypothetical protein
MDLVDNEPAGQLTALICVDDTTIQKIVSDKLSGMGYSISVGLFVEDIALKLRAQAYEVVVIHENFNQADLEANQALAETRRIPLAQRRAQFVVLVGPTMVTNNEMQAFEHSVDLVFGVSDLENLAPVLRRALAKHEEFYLPFNECLRATATR